MADLIDTTIDGPLHLKKGATNGIQFPPNSFGGTGDTASITLQNPAGGESQELTIEVTNDNADIVNIKTPSASGLKHNGNTVLTEVNSALAKPSVTYLSRSGHNSMAMVMDGELYTTAGNNAYYGNTTTGRNFEGHAGPFGVLKNFVKVSFPTDSPIKKVGGFFHTYAFALMENGQLYTWGKNASGACGLGHTYAVAVPTLAETNVLDAYDHPSQGEYSVDYGRLFILKSDGLYAAGSNGQGQCGIDATTNPVKTFTKCVFDQSYHPTPDDIIRVFPMGTSTGATFVLCANKAIYACGYNAIGGIGMGTAGNTGYLRDLTSYWATGDTSKIIDIKVSGSSRYYTTEASNGLDHYTMLIKYNDGTAEVRTCGYNGQGQLGDGTTTNTASPVTPINLGSATPIDIADLGGGISAVQVLMDNGDLYSWGRNHEFQVGSASGGDVISTPILVTSNVKELMSDGMAAHLYGYRPQSIIKKSDNAIYSYGYDDNGMTMLGAGSMYYSYSNSNIRRVLLPKDDDNVTMLGHFCTYASNRTFLALTTKGNIYVWGYNGQYSIESDNIYSNTLPVPITLPKYYVN